MADMFVIKLTKIKIEVDRGDATEVARVEGVRRITNFCRKAQNQAIIDCPVDTGNLRGHHRMRTKTMTTKVVGEVYNDANYAASVHDGSGPHVIRGRRMRRPTRKRKYKGVKTLRFVVGGTVVYRRRVNHPGGRPRPWLREAGKKVAEREGFQWSNGAAGEAA
jgi:hypothetical protein